MGLCWNQWNGWEYLFIWYLPSNSAVPKSNLILWSNIMKLIRQSQTSSFGSRFGREHLISQNSPPQEGYRKAKIRPTRIGVGRVSFSHTSSRGAPKSCFGFVGGRGGCWLSSRVLELHQKAQFLTELVLTVFLSESNVEERFFTSSSSAYLAWFPPLTFSSMFIAVAEREKLNHLL